MPYHGPSDSTLPKNVKAMPKAKRSQWIEIFNSATSSGKDEATAFAMANGVAKKATKADDKAYGQGIGSSLEGSYEDLTEDILQQVNTANEDDYDCYYGIIGTFADYAICGSFHWMGDASYWKIPYTMDGVEPKLSDHTEWEELEIDFVPVGEGQYSDEDDDWEVAGDKAELDSGKGSPKRSKLKKSDFAYVDEDGKGHFPIQDAAHVRNALARLSQSPYGDKARKKVMAAARRFGIKVSKPKADSKAVGAEGVGPSFLSKVMQAVTHLRGKKEVRPFFVTKDANAMRFFTVMTNNFTDREGELFTASSHKSYIKWCDTQGSYPELWVWHAKGTRFGQVDWLDFVDDGGAGVVVSSGLIDPGQEPLAEWLSTKDVAMSHGFIGHRTKEGYWTDYVSWEESVLPREAVANYGTAFNLLTGGKDMPFNETKRSFLSSLPGATEADVKDWEKQTTELVKNLKSLGIDYKAMGAEPDEDDDKGADAKKATAADGTKELAITKEFLDERNGMVATMKAMTDKMAELVGRAEAAEKSAAATLEAATKAGVNVDEAIKAGVKDAMTPRLATATGFQASSSATNTVEGAVKEASDSWLMKGVDKMWGNFGLSGAQAVEGNPMDKVVAAATNQA